MSGFIGSVLVGIVCIFLGISNMRGNISSLHSYHTQRVSEEDRIPFGKKIGLGTVLIGLALVIFGVLSAVTLYTQNQLLAVIGTAVLIAGLAIGLGLSVYAMLKYNKGIF